jgi:hypothetical protein
LLEKQNGRVRNLEQGAARINTIIAIVAPVTLLILGAAMKLWTK